MKMERHQPPEFDVSASIWGDDTEVVVTDRPIGNILTETRRLAPGQVQVDLLATEGQRLAPFAAQKAEPLLYPVRRSSRQC